MNKLDNVTIVAICHEKQFKETIKAVDYSMSQIEFAHSLIITEDKLDPEYRRMLAHKFYPKVQIKTLDKEIDLPEYNRMCIEDLYQYIDTDYCLVVQWDGFVVDANRWEEEFLEYDYIGSPWVVSGVKNNVGNGGFSLRSKKFLKACSKYKYSPDPKDCTWVTPLQAVDMPITPEDWFMCYHNYDNLLNDEIKFPDMHIAYKFSVEHASSLKPFAHDNIKTYKSFGFHGSFNTAGMELLNVR